MYNAGGNFWSPASSSYLQSPFGVLVWLSAQVGSTRAGCSGLCEHVHRWRHHNLSEQPVPVSDHLHWEAVLNQNVLCVCLSYPLGYTLPSGECAHG